MGEEVNVVDGMNGWFTITEISEETSIPSETVRRYVRQYGDYLHIKRGERRSYLLHQASIDAVKKIRYLLDQGKQHEQVLEILGQTEVLNVQTNDERTNEYMMNLPQIQRETLKELQSVSEDNKKLIDTLNKVNERMNKYEKLLQGQQDSIKTDLIEELTERLDEQQTYIDDSLKERDKLLMQSINELMESKRQAAAEKEEEKKGFFSRIFNK